MKTILLIGSVGLSVVRCAPAPQVYKVPTEQVEINPDIALAHAGLKCMRENVNDMEKCFPKPDLRPTKHDQELVHRYLEDHFRKVDLEQQKLWKSLEPSPETTARLERERVAEQERLASYLPSDVLECTIVGNTVFGFIGAKKVARNDCLEARRLRASGS